MGKSHYFRVKPNYNSKDGLCEWCGKPMPEGRRGKYCSKECYKQATKVNKQYWFQRNKERLYARRRELYRENPEKYYPKKKYKKKKWKVQLLPEQKLSNRVLFARDVLIKKELILKELLSFQMFTLQHRREFDNREDHPDFYWGVKGYDEEKCNYIRAKLHSKRIYLDEMIEDRKDYHLRPDRGAEGKIPNIENIRLNMQRKTFLTDKLPELPEEETS